MILKPQTNFDHLSFARRMLRGGSAAVLSAAMMSGVAMAQDVPADDEVDEVVATGIRQSLESAAAIKRNADAFVDAITAEDIGALPDRSVSEALQRVPGVSVLRFAGPNDPDHFSVEGSGVVIRGLPFVRSELNGRNVLGANASAQLGFEDVSPELLGSVEVFKNQSADMIEGGLSGTVDLNTRKPFDNPDSIFAFSLEGTYSDLIDKVSPSRSVLGSKRWDTPIGEFGLLGSFSDNELFSRTDATQLGDFRPYDSDGNPINDQSAITADTRYIPSGGGIRSQEFERERQGISIAGQWASNDGTMEATAEFFQSESGTAWTEKVLETSFDDGPSVIIDPDATFNSQGLFTSGVITSNSGWRGLANLLPEEGIRQLALTRERVEDDKTSDYSFNFKYTPSDRLRFNLDAQYVDSEASVTDVTVHFATYGVLDIDATQGTIPQINYNIPRGEEASFYEEPSSWYIRSKMDHITQNEADELSLRADVEYDVDKGWLESVRVGGRFSDRDNLIQESTFNWGNISEIWTFFDGSRPTFTGPGGVETALLTLDNPIFPGGAIGLERFEGFQRGDVTAGISGAPFWNGPLASDYEGFLNLINPVIDAVYTNAPNQGGATLANRNGVVPGTPFIPSEISPLNQKSFAAYTRLDFGGDLNNGMALSGNVGLRYVRTEVESDGTFNVNPFTEVFGAQANRCDPDADAEAAGVDRPAGLLPAFCARDLASLQTFFGNGTQEQRAFEYSYDRLLPSLNAKLDLNDEMLIRFGAARSMTRPDVLQLRSDFNIFEAQSLPIEDPANPGVSQGQGLIAFTGNPFLNPIMSNQLDLSYEWYFGDANSFTASVFWKKIEDFWIRSTIATPLTNNGVTLDVTNSTTVNADDKASIKGFELAYQQFYDFLPGLLGNIGFQGNYTYIDADGLADIDNTITGRFPRDGESFERVSKHQFNIAGLYEDDKISARLAYNWRDNFLLTRQDVIFPFASIYQKATGQLDGSIFYTINDNFKVGLTGTNLLDDITETEQTINANGLRGPRSFIINDRRFTLSLRANF